MRTPLVAVWLTACSAVATTTVAPVTIRASEVTTTVAITRDELTPPWTLTASDGSGLALTRVTAKAVVEGPLAFTELHLYFKNDQARTREGRFQITLPQRAAISRFAMENAGTWMEAEVVPKMTARRAYEDFLHRRQDPALLEKAAGNQFTARVFPIAPDAEKHLVISYSQALPGQRYMLPLRGLPKTTVDVELAFVASDGTRTTQKLAERDWLPDRDFVATSVATPAAVFAAGHVAAQIEIEGIADPEAPAGITLLVDTSASRSLGFASYVAAIRKLVGELRSTWGDELPLEVVAFDQDTEQIFDGLALEFGDAHAAKLIARGAAGASDVGQALAELAKRSIKPRIVMIGDGVITAGLEGRALHDAAKQLKAERFDVVLAGGLRDDRVASMLARSLGRAGAVLDLELDPVARALGEAVAVDIPIDVPGASWVYPRRIASARAGSKVMVYAKVATPTLTVVAGSTRRVLHPLPGTAPLVERAIAGAEIAELEARAAIAKADEAGPIRTAIAKKSVASRVLSRETAMLVLETEADYPRYGIDRKALGDVLVVGPRGVVRLPRGTPAPLGPGGVQAETDTVAPRGPERTPPVPDSDRDADGIPDAQDRCPDEPETHNNLDDDDGCPDRGRIIVSETSLIVLEPITFASGSDVLDAQSRSILDVIAVTLHDHPDIARVEVAGHTDDLGDAGANLALSDRRAATVMRYLIQKGVDRRRLTSRGYGETRPVERPNSPGARARNRRVEFVILARDVDAAPQTSPRRSAPPAPPPPPAVVGELATIENALARRDLDGALAHARAWHAREPGNVLALIGLGEALEARRATAMAARIYGSIIDLFPGRADMRRFAGQRLAKLAVARHLEIDTLQRAVADRPDHLTGHRLLAYAFVRAGRHADAFAAILGGLGHDYRDGSFRGGLRVLGEDAAMIGAVYAKAVPAKRDEIVAALAKRKLELATGPSTRFVLYWETDSNDVDLHVHDGKGDHASFEHKSLASGGALYDDVTSGYGPECFAIAGTPTGGPYKLSVHYYAQGPMGYGMGMLEIQKFDPAHGFAFEQRPYVIMNAHARVDLGVYRD